MTHQQLCGRCLVSIATHISNKGSPTQGALFEMADKALPTLAVIRQKRGITWNDAAVDTPSGQSDTSGRSYAVCRSNVDRVFREDQKLEALRVTTSNRCRQRRMFRGGKNKNVNSDLWNALEVADK